MEKNSWKWNGDGKEWKIMVGMWRICGGGREVNGCAAMTANRYDWGSKSGLGMKTSHIRQ